VNQQSWTNLSSVLYIEQPVGTGYSQGTPNIQNEDDLAAQFVGFLQQFLEIFPELKGKMTYLAGESVSSELPLIGSWALNSIRVLLSMLGCIFPVG
jgi:carboxypeptidase D